MRCLILLLVLGCRQDGLHFDVAALDRGVDPCADFYEYACSGWRRTHPIPPDRARWSRYVELIELNLGREHELVSQAPKTAAYFDACMDEAGIERRGYAPIAPLLRAIDAIEKPADVVPVLATLRRAGIAALFDVAPDADPRDARKMILMLDIGELALEDPDDYRRDTGTLAAHIERVLRLVGDRTDGARVVALETALARAMPTAAERHHQDQLVHVTPIDQLPTAAAFVHALGISPSEIDVLSPPLVAAVDAAIAGDLVALRAELRYRVARKFASVLPHALDAEVFDFAQHTLRGTRAMPPRWKRCLALVDRDLGDEIGQLFVARYFSPASRTRARAEVDRIVAAFRRDLASLDWLGDAARKAALAKVANLRFTIGYSDRWKRYDDVAVTRDDPVGNAEHAQAATLARELAKLGRPTDRDEFFALAQELDGFGTDSRVSVGFTAGFLQPPVFDAELDDAVNYGGFGGVIGHEITHHFDSEGRKYDVDGNLAPWWSPADVASYEQRAACFVDEYARFGLDGQLSLRENLADNGGLRLAWDALEPSYDGPTLDGLTPAQRFFVAWGQIRCENTTAKALKSQIHNDGHAPGRFRVNGVVANMPEFARAFGCRAGAPMAPVKRCRLW